MRCTHKLAQWGLTLVPARYVRCRATRSCEGKSRLRNTSCNLWLQGFLQVTLSFRSCNVRCRLESNSAVRNYYYYYYYYYFTHFPYFAAVQPVLKTVVSLIKHFLFTVLPKTSNCTACIIIIIIIILPTFLTSQQFSRFSKQ